jgi:phytoene/squalene synthetase
MKALFDKVSVETSKLTTRAYSTSFSLGIYCLDKKFHQPVYSIYGFVRFADEIVDTFHEYNKTQLLDEFETETNKAIERGISMNPILNSFQAVVNEYNIERELIDCFMRSMRTDLHQAAHSTNTYKEYILGSAEVVGLMCLRVFTENNTELYAKLKPAAMSLGSAFQKVNFLRDLKDDFTNLGRTYFPGLDVRGFNAAEKQEIENDIENDFAAALAGIKILPKSSMFGVYVAYVYYRNLFQKIKSIPPDSVMLKRIRINNYRKLGLLFTSYFRHSLNMI